MFNKNKKKVNKTKLSYFLQLYNTINIWSMWVLYKIVAKTGKLFINLANVLYSIFHYSKCRILQYVYSLLIWSSLSSSSSALCTFSSAADSLSGSSASSSSRSSYFSNSPSVSFSAAVAPSSFSPASSGSSASSSSCSFGYLQCFLFFLSTFSGVSSIFIRLIFFLVIVLIVVDIKIWSNNHINTSFDFLGDNVSIGIDSKD